MSITIPVLMLLGLTAAPSANPDAADADLGCVARLDVKSAVHEALSLRAQTVLDGVGGTWRLDADELPEGLGWELGPVYPLFGAYEFRFSSDLPDLEENRAALCDVLEARLESSCEVVRRSNLVLTCSFVVESGDYTGTVVTLPDNEGPSLRALILVVNEW